MATSASVSVSTTGLGGTNWSGHAPEPPRQGEAICGLCRPDCAVHRLQHGQDPRGPDRCGDAGGFQLHLRPSHLEPGIARLDRVACARPPIPWRRAGTSGAGQYAGDAPPDWRVVARAASQVGGKNVDLAGVCVEPCVENSKPKTEAIRY